MLVTTETVSSFRQHPCRVQKATSHSSPPHPSPLTNILSPSSTIFSEPWGWELVQLSYPWPSTQSLILRTLNNYQTALTITYGSKEPSPHIIISSLNLKLTLNIAFLLFESFRHLYNVCQFYPSTITSPQHPLVPPAHLPPNFMPSFYCYWIELVLVTCS